MAGNKISISDSGDQVTVLTPESTQVVVNKPVDNAVSITNDGSQGTNVNVTSTENRVILPAPVLSQVEVLKPLPNQVTISQTGVQGPTGIQGPPGNTIFNQTGSFYNTTNNVGVTGSFVVSGSFFLNNVDIRDSVGRSGIFTQTGSFYNTTNNVGITGSLFVNLNGTTDLINITIQGEPKIKVNEEGVLQLKEFSSPPTPVTGGIFYSTSNEFYLGM